jgi:heat shock protein HtpX
MSHIIFGFNIIITWAYVFILTGLTWSIWDYPGDKLVLIISGYITLGLIIVGLTSFGERITVFLEGFRKPTLEEQYYILPHLHAVCKAAKKPLPLLYIQDCNGINAMAIGRHSVIVTSRVVGHVQSDELCGLLAHELGHLVNRDTVRLNAIYYLNLLGNILVAVIVGLILGLTDDERNEFTQSPLLLIVGLLKGIQFLVQLFLKLGDYAICRREELRADSYAKNLGYGEGLTKFLKRGFEYKRRSSLFNTHPTNKTRLENLAR